jgi:hypothetical protein
MNTWTQSGLHLLGLHCYKLEFQLIILHVHFLFSTLCVSSMLPQLSNMSIRLLPTRTFDSRMSWLLIDAEECSDDEQLLIDLLILHLHPTLFLSGYLADVEMRLLVGCCCVWSSVMKKQREYIRVSAGLCANSWCPSQAEWNSPEIWSSWMFALERQCWELLMDYLFKLLTVIIGLW